MSVGVVQVWPVCPLGFGSGLFAQAGQDCMGTGESNEIDEALVLGCLGRDDQSFARLIARYEGFLPDEDAKEKKTLLLDYVVRMLEQLSPKDRLVLTLQYFEGADLREIAERMGWSISATKVRAFRARKRLKACLLEMEGDVR